jgi:hypothetical protein
MALHNMYARSSSRTPLPVYGDVSLKAFDEIVPAAGSTHGAEWADVRESRG